jgi:hypothetical protein
MNASHRKAEDMNILSAVLRMDRHGGLYPEYFGHPPGLELV